MTDRVEIYRSRRGKLRRTQWRARVIAPNGRVLFTSAESYNNVDDLLAITDRLFPDLPREGVGIVAPDLSQFPVDPNNDASNTVEP